MRYLSWARPFFSKRYSKLMFPSCHIFKGKLFSNNGNKVFTTKSVMSLDFFHVSGKSKI